MAIRYDSRKLGKAQRTAQGYPRLDARLTRVGVLDYPGLGRKELRHPDEVFAPESLASAQAGLPVTVGHPAALVTLSNSRDLKVGTTVRDAAAEGRFVSAPIQIEDAQACARIDAGDLVELSTGYTCDYDPTPGVWEGQAYDGIQRNIRYNHVALLPAGGGRAGSEVSLRLDAGDGLSFDEEREDGGPGSGPQPGGGSKKEPKTTTHTKEQLQAMSPAKLEAATAKAREVVAHHGDELIAQGRGHELASETHEKAKAGDSLAQKWSSATDAHQALLGEASRRMRYQGNTKRTPRTDAISFDTQDVDVPSSSHPTVTPSSGIRMKTIKLDGVEFEVPEALAAAFAALETNLGKAEADKADLSKRLDAACDPAALDAHVAARVELVAKAQRVLGGEFKADGKSDHDVRCAAIAKALPTLKLDGVSADYARGVFASVCETAPVNGAHPSHQSVAAALAAGRRDDSAEVVDSEKAYRDACAEKANALKATK
jgi:hypothetical protein